MRKKKQTNLKYIFLRNQTVQDIFAQLFHAKARGENLTPKC